MGAIYAQNGAKRPLTAVSGAFVGAFGVLYVLAVARLPLWGDFRGFLARLGVWGVWFGCVWCFPWLLGAFLGEGG